MNHFMIDDSVFGKYQKRATEFCMSLVIHGGILKIIEEDAKLDVSRICLDTSERKGHIEMVGKIVKTREDISRVLMVLCEKELHS